MTLVAGTTPYPWPWDGGLDPARLALLAVSCPGGPAEEDDIAQRIALLAGIVRRAGGLVLAIEVQAPAAARLRRPKPAAVPRPPSPEPGDRATASARFPLRPDHVLRAAGWSGFHGTGLDAVLRAERRDLLLLTGCCLEIGVHSTMRAANDRGYECLLVADACASTDPGLTANALSTIEMSGGIFGAVGDGTAVAEALLPLVTERTMS
ncbi:isochorismatase family cysteine hydrolase [Thermopolyspora sp. NPDC052614]|uniref:cysteine hydrolase family protein n=1 Tax=Thermopolyspora sp. NPDC052614 TaxID=3155682 RepID=UPI003444CDF7